MEFPTRRNEGSGSRLISPKRNRNSSQRDRKSRSRSSFNYLKSRSKSLSRSRSRSGSNHKSRSTYPRSRSRSYSSDDRRSPRSRSRFIPLDKSNRCLGVFGLGCDTNEDQLLKILSKYGPIDKINVIMNAKSGKSRGFGFVYFKYIEDARKAKEKCSGMILDGHKIRIDFSYTRHFNSSTRHGAFMGRNVMRRSDDDRYDDEERYDRYYCGESYDRHDQDNYDDYVHERRRDEHRERRSPTFEFRYLHDRSNSRSLSPCRYA